MLQIPRQFLFQISLILTVILIGTLGYTLIERWSLFDSLYMTVITLTTIGFGETHPLSTAGRAFTLFLIIGGIGAITYALGSISSYFFGENVYNFVKKRRMKEKIGKLKSHFIVCGASEVGLAVVAEIALEGVPVVLIDRNGEKLEKVAQMYKNCTVLVGDATREATLQSAGIHKAKGLIASFGNDHENVYLIMSARCLNKDLKIYAKVKEEETADKLILAGADQVINPYQIGGLRMASLILRPHVVKLMDEFVKDPQKLRVEELHITKNHPLAHKNLQIEAVEEKMKFRVIAYKAHDSAKYEYMFGHREISFMPGDSLFFLQAKQPTG